MNENNRKMCIKNHRLAEQRAENYMTFKFVNQPALAVKPNNRLSNAFVNSNENDDSQSKITHKPSNNTQQSTHLPKLV